MTQLEGRLYICDRCGAKLFVKKDGLLNEYKIEDVRDWQIVTDPDPRKSENGVDALLCPSCYKEYLDVMAGFMFYQTPEELGLYDDH